MEKPQAIINDLNTRQWRLVEFLESQSEYLSKTDILEKSKLYDDPVKTARDSQYRGASRLLTHDLQMIKESKRYNKILITDRKGIKIAQTDEEVIDYLKREKAEILRRFRRYYIQSEEYRNRDQFRIVFGKEKDIEEVLNVMALKEIEECIGI